MTALARGSDNSAPIETPTTPRSPGRVNPHFCPAPDEVRSKWTLLASTPYEHPRTVVVLCGWRAPLAALKSVRAHLRTLMPGTRVIPIAFPRASSMREADHATRQVLDARQLADTPLDIVAISMGGLIARALAAGLFGTPTPIHSLFTFATPHRGAVLAKYIRPDSAARDMRPGSPFLRDLDAALPGATFHLTPYGYKRDWWVGCDNTAPPGYTPLWLDPPDIRGRIFSHFMITTERRIILDVALRLRGLPALSRHPSDHAASITSAALPVP